MFLRLVFVVATTRQLLIGGTTSTSTAEHGLRDLRSVKDFCLRIGTVIKGINLDGWKVMLELLGKARVVACVCLSILFAYTECEGFLCVCVVCIGC